MSDFNGNYDLMLDVESGYYEDSLDPEHTCTQCGRELETQEQVRTGLCRKCVKEVDEES